MPIMIYFPFYFFLGHPLLTTYVVLVNNGVTYFEKIRHTTSTTSLGGLQSFRLIPGLAQLGPVWSGMAGHLLTNKSMKYCQNMSQLI